MKKHSIVLIALLALSGASLEAALTAAEIANIEGAFGITLSTNQIQELDAVVNPTNSATWRTDAEARIDQHRKADLDIQVVDMNGDPVEGAEVSIRLKNNDFKFGGVVTVMDLTDANGNLSAEGSTSNDWKRITTNLFNAVGLNNGFKPKITGQHEYIPGFLSWAGSNDIDVRGHLLMWPGGGHLDDLDDTNAVSGVDYGDHLTRSYNSDYATHNVLGAVDTYKNSARGVSDKTSLKAEVDAEILEWVSQWDVYEWDVINETVGNTLLQEILGYDQMAEWFKIAETNKVSPNTGLYINEFKVISADHTDADDQYNTRKGTYTDRISNVITNGGPITGIGFQSRFKYGHISPKTVYNRLDEFATLYPDFTLAGTEFEIKDGQVVGGITNVYDEFTRAQMTEEILTTYFSHDQVLGLNAWDFMNSTSDPDPAEVTSALALYDGTIKLNGLAWYYLHRIRYNTEATLSSGLDGRTGLRAFKGDYAITASYKGQTVSSALVLTNGESVVITLNSVIADDPSTTAVIDAWNYDGLTDGSDLSSALSTGVVGGLSISDNKILSSIQNETVRWQSDGVADSLYKNVIPSSSVGADSGLYQVSMDYLDADFSASAVVSNGSGRVALGVRSDVADDANFRLVFDSGGGSSPEFRLEVTDDLNSNQEIATFPGTTLDHLSVRAVYDFDSMGSTGSYKVYYRLSGGSEVAAHMAGQLPTGFALDQLRLTVQTYNGGVNWAAGDRIYTDNLVLRSLSEAPPVFFTVDPISKPSGSNDVSYTGQSISGTASNALSYSKVAGPAWLSIAPNGDLSGTPTPADVGQNSWIVQASNGGNTDTAVLSIFVIGSGAGGPGSDISIVSGPTTDNDDSVTGEMVFPSMSVQAGDVVAIATSPNKGSGVNHMSLQWSGTNDIDGTLTTVESADLNNRTTYLFYIGIINTGTYDFTVVPDSTSLTAQSSLFVLRANSGIIQVADAAIFAQNTSIPGLTYDFSPITLTTGIVVEAFAANGGTSLTLDGNYSATQNENGRNIAYSSLVSGSSWNKTHTSDAGAQDYVGAGAVFYEQTSGGGNNPPVFTSDPVVGSSAETDSVYSSSLAGSASDGDSDPMSFEKVSGPTWLTVATNGTLSGTPLVADLGTNRWKVSVTDGTATNFATLGIEAIQTTPPPPIASPDRDRLLPTNSYNVLFIAIDDMRPLIDAYGETDPLRPITPNMDRLADSGVMFANAHCQQAVCNASRASLMTGLRPDTTMSWKLDTLFRVPLPNVITLPQHFGANGYRVHGIGKIYHSTNPTWQDDPTSWNEGWSSSSTDYKWYEADKAALEDAGTGSVSATDAGEVNTRDSNRPILDEDYNDGYAAVQGVAKIAEYAGSYQTNGTPFFLAVGFQKPHLPFNAPKTYWDLYNPALIDLVGYTGIRQMPVGANKFTAPYGGEPSGFLDITGTSDNNMPNATEARHLIHGYLACVSYIDTQVGKLLDALEDPDGNPSTDDSVADNTIIVLWGDHGFHLGDHNGFWAKHSNYEISTRVPLIVRAPGMEELSGTGARCEGLVELVDIYPTLLDLCSLPAPAQPAGQALQGTTFLPLLEDPAQPWKKAVFSQFQRVISDNEPGDVPVANSGGGMGYSARTERYRYTEWWVTDSNDETDRHIIKAGITEPGHIELYDYVNDPGETTNLAANVSYSNLVAELSALLNDSDGVSAGDGWTLPGTDAPIAYPIDSNGWKTNYLAPGRTLSELDFNNDPDGDGIINLFEYKFGTHPFHADASVVQSGFENDGLYMTYPDVESRTNVLLEAATTTDLRGTWTSTGVTTTNEGIFGNATIKTGTVPSDDPTRFLRLEATEQ